MKTEAQDKFVQENAPMLLAFAWRYFQKKGRGALLVTHGMIAAYNGSGSTLVPLSFAPLADSENAPDELLSYDPEVDAVVAFIDQDGEPERIITFALPDLTPREADAKFGDDGTQN